MYYISETLLLMKEVIDSERKTTFLQQLAKKFSSIPN